MDFFEADYNEGVERGCGVREPGGIYAVCPIGYGYRDNTKDFWFDPPLPLGNVDVPNRGVALVERPDGSGVWDIYDRVGESGYPNVADMLEEIGKHGLSRRLGKALDFSKITKESRIFLVHNKAIIDNAEDLYDMLQDEWHSGGTAHPFNCPCHRVAHEALPGFLDDATERPMCAGLWYETVTKGDANYDPGAYMRSVTRVTGDTTYHARQAPHEFHGEYSPGIFARYPVTRLEIVEDPDGDEDFKAHERADRAGVPVYDVEF